MSGWDEAAFVAAMSAKDGSPVVDPPMLEALAQAVQDASEAWSELSFPPGLPRFIAQRLPTSVEDEGPVVPLVIRDLYLTCACLAGDQAAIRLLAQHVERSASGVLAKLHLDSAAGHDLMQQVLERLVVPEAGAKLAGYGGRGPLKAWLRSFLVRTALKQTRRNTNKPSLPDDQRLLDAVHVESEYLSHHYGTKFRQALSLAFQELSARERNLLRQHYLDQLTLAQLAKLYVVNRSTVARWLGTARARLVTRTRRVARQQLGIPRREFDSLLRLVWSQLRPNLRELLRSTP